MPGFNLRIDGFSPPRMMSVDKRRSSAVSAGVTIATLAMFVIAIAHNHAFGLQTTAIGAYVLGVAAALFGALMGGALGEAIGARGALVAGVGILLTPVWLMFSPVRSLRTLTPH